MTGYQIRQTFERMGKSLERNVVLAVNETAREGRKIARQDSSGRWNRKRRQKAGYSYSRFEPNPPPQSIAIINVETGEFRAGWYYIAANKQGGAVTAFVMNESDRVADLVDASGKPWLSRPIDKRVRARIAPVFQFNVEKAVLRSLRG